MLYKTKLVNDLTNNNIKVFAFGGLDEIGKNMYGIEVNDELVIIDCGIKFPDERYGVEYIIQDYSYLKANEAKIVGIFITHGHEDHIGALPFILDEINIPKIYAKGFAINLIESKLNQTQRANVEIVSVSIDDVFKFKNFSVEFFNVSHSIPDAVGIAVKTKLGYIIHTGDFKFDLTPIGDPFEFHKLTRYAEHGVLLLLSDSTNAFIEEVTASEKSIGESIKTLMNQMQGRVIIATFASNVYRVKQIIEASQALDRKVVIFGRSMEKNVNVAKQLNYLDVNEETFINPKDKTQINQRNLTIISTGSQGEPLAALSRMADGTHREIKLIPGDTVVFSSSAIPGNQASINNTINALYKAGVDVIVNSPLTDTHTSGHASAEELKLMIALTRPKYFMPIHGEFSMMKRHAELANELGIPEANCFCLENGEVIEFTKTDATVTKRISADDIYIDSNRKNMDHALLWERRNLSSGGVIGLIFVIEDELQITRPEIVSRGFVFMNSATDLIEKIIDHAEAEMDNFLIDNPNYELANAERHIINKVSKFISDEVDMNPVIVPIIMDTRIR